MKSILYAATFFLAGCASSGKAGKKSSGPSLKQIFQNDFVIGAAVNLNQLDQRDSSSKKLLNDQFNAVTPENLMKAQWLQPQWGQYNFAEADKLVALAASQKLLVNGHTLIWHSQLPNFVRRINDADSVRKFFTDHITKVAGRYDGKIDSWDVVNEALNEDGTMRKSVFLDKLGDNFVVEAFRLAQQAAPNTKLYYNDYNIEQPRKRAGAIALIKKIQAAGVRIDGVGIQGHWSARNPPLADIEKSIEEFSALGIDVMFTELDLNVLPSPGNVTGADVNQSAAYQDKINPYRAGLPDSVQAVLAKGYEDIFRIFLKHKDKIGRITFWGVSDNQSWLNNWPVRGRTNYPLLFDRQFKPKPAFYSVAALKK